MEEFIQWLSRNLEGPRGTQSRVSEALSFSKGTISGWKKEKKPDLESCLKLADYFDTDPRDLFRMLGREDYIRLYDRFFGEYRSLTEADLYKGPSEADLHRRFQELLDIHRIRDQIEQQIGLLEDSVATPHSVLGEAVKQSGAERAILFKEGLIEGRKELLRLTLLEVIGFFEWEDTWEQMEEEGKEIDLWDSILRDEDNVDMIIDESPADLNKKGWTVIEASSLEAEGYFVRMLLLKMKRNITSRRIPAFMKRELLQSTRDHALMEPSKRSIGITEWRPEGQLVGLVQALQHTQV